MGTTPIPVSLLTRMICPGKLPSVSSSCRRSCSRRCPSSCNNRLVSHRVRQSTSRQRPEAACCCNTPASASGSSIVCQWAGRLCRWCWIRWRISSSRGWLVAIYTTSSLEALASCSARRLLPERAPPRISSINRLPHMLQRITDRRDGRKKAVASLGVFRKQVKKRVVAAKTGKVLRCRAAPQWQGTAAQSADKLLTRLGTANQTCSGFPELALGRFQLTELFQHLIQSQAVGVGHRATALGREAITETVYAVDIFSAFGKALIQNPRTFVDQGQNATLNDFLVAHLALGITGLFGHFTGHHVGFRIMNGLTAARLVAVETVAALLTETAHLAQTVVQPHDRLTTAQTGQLTRAPAQIHTHHVVHTVRTHGHAEALQRLVDLPRSGAFQYHFAGLARVHGQHAVADETVAVARQYRFLADLLADGQAGIQHVLGSGLAAHHFQQLHDMGRAEEVQTQHLGRPLGRRGDLVDKIGRAHV